MFKDIISRAEYSFLRTDERLGKNVILLGLCGSYSYGTNNENSDIDIRGCALNSRREILLGRELLDNTELFLSQRAVKSFIWLRLKTALRHTVKSFQSLK